MFPAFTLIHLPAKSVTRLLYEVHLPQMMFQSVISMFRCRKTAYLLPILPEPIMALIIFCVRMRQLQGWKLYVADQLLLQALMHPVDFSTIRLKRAATNSRAKRPLNMGWKETIIPITVLTLT